MFTFELWDLEFSCWKPLEKSYPTGNVTIIQGEFRDVELKKEETSECVWVALDRLRIVEISQRPIEELVEIIKGRAL